jgi:hypothetical protein
MSCQYRTKAEKERDGWKATAYAFQDSYVKAATDLIRMRDRLRTADDCANAYARIVAAMDSDDLRKAGVDLLEDCAKVVLRYAELRMEEMRCGR